MSDGITHFHLAGYFDAGNQISDVSGGDLIPRLLLQFQDTNLLREVLSAGIDELNSLPLLDQAVEDPEINLYSPEGIEDGVENHRLKRCLGLAHRRFYPLDDGIEDFL